MTTLQQVYDIAIRLMDAQHETGGHTDTPENREYLLRTPSLVNSLLDRLYPLSDTCPGTDGSRPVSPRVYAMDDQLDLDLRVAEGVLPYGLAGLLLSGEDPARADFFWQTFLEQCHECRFTLPAGEVAVEEVYGGIGGGNFGRWA